MDVLIGGIVTTKDLVKLLEQEQKSEVRALVAGDTALISPAAYESVRISKERVISAIGIIDSG